LRDGRKVAVAEGIPVFPQTYGWDSRALLTYAEGGLKGRKTSEDRIIEGESFRWLLEKGFIRVRLRKQPSIWHAAMAAFGDPDRERSLLSKLAGIEVQE
jgi:hypothetical protein